MSCSCRDPPCPMLGGDGVGTARGTPTTLLPPLFSRPPLPPLLPLQTQQKKLQEGPNYTTGSGRPSLLRRVSFCRNTYSIAMVTGSHVVCKNASQLRFAARRWTNSSPLCVAVASGCVFGLAHTHLYSLKRLYRSLDGHMKCFQQMSLDVVKKDNL